MTAGNEIESVADLGAAMRRARQEAHMTQEQLADRIGATRQWVIRAEQGNPTVTMSMMLLALAELGLEMVAHLDRPPKSKKHKSPVPPQWARSTLAMSAGEGPPSR